MPTVGANPYKGLRAFREADAAEFYGRGELVERLVAAVDAEPFVTVVGPSGSGKSSLVHAGLVPAFRRRGALVVSMVPGTEPLVELESALRTRRHHRRRSLHRRTAAQPRAGSPRSRPTSSNRASSSCSSSTSSKSSGRSSTPNQTRDRFAELLTHAARTRSPRCGSS